MAGNNRKISVFFLISPRHVFPVAPTWAAQKKNDIRLATTCFKLWSTLDICIQYAYAHHRYAIFFLFPLFFFFSPFWCVIIFLLLFSWGPAYEHCLQQQFFSCERLPLSVELVPSAPHYFVLHSILPIMRMRNCTSWVAADVIKWVSPNVHQTAKPFGARIWRKSQGSQGSSLLHYTWATKTERHAN